MTCNEQTCPFDMGGEVGSYLKIRSEFTQARFEQKGNLILQLYGPLFGVGKGRDSFASNQVFVCRIYCGHQSRRSMTYGRNRLSGGIEIPEQAHEVRVAGEIEHGSVATRKEYRIEVLRVDVRQRHCLGELVGGFLPARGLFTGRFRSWIDGSWSPSGRGNSDQSARGCEGLVWHGEFLKPQAGWLSIR